MAEKILKQQTEIQRRECPYCRKRIENIDINYCLNCRNIIWAKPFYRKKVI